MSFSKLFGQVEFGGPLSEILSFLSIFELTNTTCYVCKSFLEATESAMFICRKSFSEEEHKKMFNFKRKNRVSGSLFLKVIRGCKLDYGFKINGYTLLEYACIRGYTEVVNYIIENPNEYSLYPSPLCINFTIKKGNLRMLKLLFSKIEFHKILKEFGIHRYYKDFVYFKIENVPGFYSLLDQYILYLKNKKTTRAPFKFDEQYKSEYYKHIKYGVTKKMCFEYIKSNTNKLEEIISFFRTYHFLPERKIEILRKVFETKDPTLKILKLRVLQVSCVKKKKIGGYNVDSFLFDYDDLEQKTKQEIFINTVWKESSLDHVIFQLLMNDKTFDPMFDDYSVLFAVVKKINHPNDCSFYWKIFEEIVSYENVLIPKETQKKIMKIILEKIKDFTTKNSRYLANDEYAILVKNIFANKKMTYYCENSENFFEKFLERRKKYQESLKDKEYEDQYQEYANHPKKKCIVQ